MIADAFLFSLRYLAAAIAITAMLVVIGAIMYAVAKAIAFILSILISFCSIH